MSCMANLSYERYGDPQMGCAAVPVGRGRKNSAHHRKADDLSKQIHNSIQYLLFDIKECFTSKINVIVIIDSSRSSGRRGSSRSTTYRRTVTVIWRAVAIRTAAKAVWIRTGSSRMSVTHLMVRIGRWRGRAVRWGTVWAVATVRTSRWGTIRLAFHIWSDGSIFLEWTFEYLNVPKHKTGITIWFKTQYNFL